MCACSVTSVVSYSLRPYGLQTSRLLCHGILQARRLEWVAISFSRGSSGPRDQTRISYVSPALAGGFLNVNTIWESPGKMNWDQRILDFWQQSPLHCYRDIWKIAYLLLLFKSCLTLCESDCMWCRPRGLQCAGLSVLHYLPGVFSDSCPLSQ